MCRWRLGFLFVKPNVRFRQVSFVCLCSLSSIASFLSGIFSLLPLKYFNIKIELKWLYLAVRFRCFVTCTTVTTYISVSPFLHQTFLFLYNLGYVVEAINVLWFTIIFYFALLNVKKISIYPQLSIELCKVESHFKLCCEINKFTNNIYNPAH